MFFKVKKRSVDVEKDRFDRVILIIHNLILTRDYLSFGRANLFQNVDFNSRGKLRTVKHLLILDHYSFTNVLKTASHYWYY